MQRALAEQKLRHRPDLAHVWVPLEPPQVLVAYLTQRGSRLNKLLLAVLVHMKVRCKAAKQAFKALGM